MGHFPPRPQTYWVGAAGHIWAVPLSDRLQGVGDGGLVVGSEAQDHGVEGRQRAACLVRGTQVGLHLLCRGGGQCGFRVGSVASEWAHGTETKIGKRKGGGVSTWGTDSARHTHSIQMAEQRTPCMHVIGSQTSRPPMHKICAHRPLLLQQGGDARQGVDVPAPDQGKGGERPAARPEFNQGGLRAWHGGDAGWGGWVGVCERNTRSPDEVCGKVQMLNLPLVFEPEGHGHVAGKPLPPAQGVTLAFRNLSHLEVCVGDITPKIGPDPPLQLRVPRDVGVACLCRRGGWVG